MLVLIDSPSFSLYQKTAHQALKVQKSSNLKDTQSTFSGGSGFIRYYCKAKIDRPWKFDDSTRSGFTVLPHFDLNSVYYAAFPLSRTFEKQLGVLCIKHGQLSAKASEGEL